MKALFKYGCILFIAVICCQNVISQEIVFKYYYQSEDRLAFSTSGSYLAVVSNNQIHLIETTNGNILGSTNLAEGQYVLAFSPSDNGSYVAAMIYDEINGTNLLKLFNLSTIRELTSLDEFDMGEMSDVEFWIYWKKNDEFILTNRNFSNKNTFCFMYSFKAEETYFYENFALGNPFDSWQEFSHLDGYKNTYFKAYEISADNKYLTILSHFESKDRWNAINSANPNFEVGIAEWGISGAAKNYYSAFPDEFYNEGVDSSMIIYDESEKCLLNAENKYQDSIGKISDDSEVPEFNYDKWKKICYVQAKKIADKLYIPLREFYFYEGENLIALHYDEKQHRIYGVADVSALQTMFAPTYFELFKKHDLIHNYKSIFEKTGWDHKKLLITQNRVPFYYDVNTGTFSLITEFVPDFPILENFDTLMKPGITFPEFISTIEHESNYYGEDKEWHFSPDHPYLFILSKFNGGKFALIRINTADGKMKKLFLDETPTEYEFTSDNKLILQQKTDDEISFTVIDLIKFHYLRKNSFKKKSPFELPKDMVIFNDNESRHLFIQLSDRYLDFNLSNPPFYTSYSRFDSTLQYPNHLSNLAFDEMKNDQTIYNYTFESTPFFHLNYTAINKSYDTSIFPYAHHFTGDTIEGWTEEIIDPYDYGWNVPLYYANSSNAFNNILVKFKEYDNGNAPDGKVDITNYLFTINGFEWHPPSASVFTISDNLIEKWDTSTRKGKFLFYEHETPIYAFDVMNDDSLMVAASSDGMITIWNAFTEKLISKLYLINGGKDWVFILPDNYYYGTREACKNISFAFNRHALPMEYFELRFNRPDKVLTALGGKNKLLISAYHSAYQKRLEKLGLNEKMLMIDFNIPTVDILNLNEFAAITNEDSLEVDLDLYDPSSPLHHINVYNNGVAVYSSKGLPVETKTHIRKKITFALAQGKNQIEISVTNVKGAESYKRNFEITRKNKDSEKTRYIIALGADEYQQAGFQLEYAAKDAMDFSSLFPDSSGNTVVKKLLLTGKNISTDCILKIQKFLADCKIDDEILLFYAGHGLLDGNFNYYLGTYETDFNHPQGTALCYDSLESVLDGLPTLKKLVILDACHSGEFEKEDFSFSDNINPITKEKVKFRNVGGGLNQKNELTITSLLRDVFNEMRKGNGSTVITSAGGGEFAIEGEDWQNGVFTYVLKDALTKMKADTNEDGKVLISELILYLNHWVPLLTDGQQTPSSRIINEKSNFVIK